MSRFTFHPSPRSRWVLSLVPLVMVAAAACSSTTDSAGSSGSASGNFPVTVTGSNGDVTLERAPQKIVSLSPANTEVLFAIGAGPQVSAVDDQSNFPEQAPKKQGLSGMTPNLEVIANLKPDLMVINYDPATTNPKAAAPVSDTAATTGAAGPAAKPAGKLSESLRGAKIPVLLLNAPTTLDEAYQQWQTLGKATGHEDSATKLVGTTKDRIAQAVKNAPGNVKGKSIYHHVGGFYSADSKSFIGDMYRQFALNNIADGAPDAAAANGYPKLSPEYVAKKSPDYVVTVSAKDSAELLAMKGLSNVNAVKNKAVIAMNADIASRWGPRIADFAEALSKALQQVGGGAPSVEGSSAGGASVGAPSGSGNQSLTTTSMAAAA